MTETETAPSTIASYSPATGELLGEVPVMDEGQVRQAVQRARRAQQAWAALGVAGRCDRLGRVQDVLARDSREIAARLAAETGKPRFDALLTEVTATCETIHSLRRSAPRTLARTSVPVGVLKTKRAWKEYEPYGVVGVISPWNFPLTLAMGPTVTALAAGNAVVLKPSEVTPLVGDIVRDLFAEAGMPEGVLQVVSGDGSTGAALVHAGVDKIHFTGSTATGRKIMAAAAESLTPVVMELGGKDPMVVCADADLDRTANGAVWAAFSNSGQICMSVERLYVEDAVHDALVERIVERTRTLRQGVETDDAPIDVGAMIAPSQMAIVERHVADAVDKGATVLTGGARRRDLPGDFFEPTVLTGVTHDMAIMREETFGPVLPVMRVGDADEAVRLANDTNYGLTASVWTKNRRKGEEIAGRLRAGSVLVNDHISTYAITNLPFGGVQESGFGRVHGTEGLLEFVRVKSYVEERVGLKNEPFWFPTVANPVEWAARLNGLLYRTNPVDRVKSLFGR